MFSFRMYKHCSSGKLPQHCIAYAVITFCPLGVKTQLRILLSILLSILLGILLSTLLSMLLSIQLSIRIKVLHRCISVAKQCFTGCIYVQYHEWRAISYNTITNHYCVV